MVEALDGSENRKPEAVAGALIVRQFAVQRPSAAQSGRNGPGQQGRIAKRVAEAVGTRRIAVVASGADEGPARPVGGADMATAPGHDVGHRGRGRVPQGAAEGG